MEDPKPLVLLDDLNTFEKIIEKITSGIFFLASGAPHLPQLIRDEFKPNSTIWKPQSKTYFENNETIYTDIKMDSKYMGFIEAGTIPRLFIKSAETYPFTPCMGRRTIIQKRVERCPILNKELVRYKFGEYVWKTYCEIYKEIGHIAKKLIYLGVGVNTKFALFCNTSPEFLTMTYALMFVSCPIVTLYPSLPDESVISALNQTEATWIMVDERTLPRLNYILKYAQTVKYVVISQYLEKAIYTSPDTAGILECISFEDFVSFDSDTNFLSNQPTDTNSIAFIMYTSGTTGDPKGVMISHKNILTAIEYLSISKLLFRSSSNTKPHVFLAYLPSTHIFECVAEIGIMSLGHSIAFSTPLTLFDTSPMIMKGSEGDISKIRPTLMVVVPLIVEKLRSKVLEELKNQSRIIRLIFQCGYNVKLKFRKLGYQTPFIDKIVFDKCQKIFGGNLMVSLIGGACIARETEEFANICFGTFKQGYGATETTSTAALVSFEYMKTGSIGNPNSNIEIKLIDWPEGSIYSTDKPFPGGEIAISGDIVALGYYKNKELTDESFIVDPKTGKRWFHTGDIGIILPDMTLKIIDRKKDIVKLSHGEYISVVKIEKIIIECPMVEMVCVMPNKSNEYFVALIVPQRDKVKLHSEQMSVGNESQDVESLLALNKVRESLADHIKLSVINKLTKYEIPKKFIIVQEVWIPDNNLVTPTMKIKRREIFKKYQSLLD